MASAPSGHSPPPPGAAALHSASSTLSHSPHMNELEATLQGDTGQDLVDKLGGLQCHVWDLLLPFASYQ